jgi:hypothetical protein
MKAVAASVTNVASYCECSCSLVHHSWARPQLQKEFTGASRKSDHLVHGAQKRVEVGQVVGNFRCSTRCYESQNRPMDGLPSLKRDTQSFDRLGCVLRIGSDSVVQPLGVARHLHVYGLRVQSGRYGSGLARGQRYPGDHLTGRDGHSEQTIPAELPPASLRDRMIGSHFAIGHTETSFVTSLMTSLPLPPAR